MSTNYYARIIPSRTKRELLKMLIDTNDFDAINKEVDKVYSRFKVEYNGETSGGEVHLGKRSCGWKFLWDPNMYVIRHFHKEEEISESGGRIVSRYIDDPDTVFSLYPLTKEGVKSFIDRDDVIVVDEYGEEQNKEEFWKMALEWGSDREDGGWDDKSYDEFEKKRNPTYYPFRCTDPLTKFLEQEGKVEFTSEMHGDFCSDGLRFASFTNFS